MGGHRAFSFKAAADLRAEADALGCSLPWSEDTSSLFQPLSLGGATIPNRLAVHPMEGFDALDDGRPGDTVYRRYRRYAEGGSGLIWFEATSVSPEGRSNPHQLMLTSASFTGMESLVTETRRRAAAKFGPSHEVFCVLQLTHSGRFSKPRGQAEPLAAAHNPSIDDKLQNPPLILDDESLDGLLEDFVSAARLARDAGFDGVDIKACHGYLINDLLAARSRGHSRYGGDFAGRSRFLLEAVNRIRLEIPNLLIAVRLNVFDGLPHPHGFGAAGDGSLHADLGEPRILVRRLVESGCRLVNITAGIPFLNPHLGRPFDRPAGHSSPPEEHPLEGISRLIRWTAEIQTSSPDCPVVGTGYSWLRQFFPNVGAAVLNRGMAAIIGLGRSSFAYPDASLDLKEKGALNPRKVCISCSRCTELIRALHPSGCVIRDAEIFGRIYKRAFGEEGR